MFNLADKRNSAIIKEPQRLKMINPYYLKEKRNTSIFIGSHQCEASFIILKLCVIGTKMAPNITS